jgi:hypothetical protein
MQNTSNLMKVGAGALAATGLLHLVLAPEYAEEQGYLGVLFVAGGLAALAIAVAIARRGESRAWIAGALLAAGMGIGFVLSRTTGLPGFHEGEWELSGLISLALEGIVVVAAARALRGRAPVLAQAR